MEFTEAYSTNGEDDNWTVECPSCSKEHGYSGFFDSSETETCSCGCKFKTTKMWLNDNQFIN